LDTDFLLAEIAKLYYVDKVKQKEIASRFQITPMLVSRLLKKAEDAELVHIHIKMPTSIDIATGKEIKEKYKLSECIVLDSDNNNTKDTIAKYLSQYVESLISDNCIIGLSWGKTISEFAKKFPFHNHPNATVLQLSGGFLMESDYMISPSNIVKMVSEKLNCRSFFLNAPFFIGTEEVKKQLLNDPGNMMVMSLARDSNINIIGMSRLSPESTVSKVGVLQPSDIDELYNKGAVGDISGFFIDKDGNEVDWTKSSLYMGLPLSIISKARNVICIADSEDKVNVLKAALKKKYFNILIINKEVACKLLAH
jgi:DNA-binding transcriptional regulator LsrR (DeoR family)